MKRLILFVCALCIVHCVFSQRYDYDDIYFNPKKDIKKETRDARHEMRDTRHEIQDESDSSEQSYLYDDNSQLSYTDRINLFHRADSDTTQDRLAHIADTNYTTNIFACQSLRAFLCLIFKYFFAQ